MQSLLHKPLPLQSPQPEYLNICTRALFFKLSSLSRISISRYMKRPSQIETDGSGVHLWVLLWKPSKAVEAHARRSVDGTELGLSDFGVLEALCPSAPLARRSC
jgi:hypothetical protein